VTHTAEFMTDAAAGIIAAAFILSQPAAASVMNSAVWVTPLRCTSWTMFASGKGWIRNRTWSDALNTACVVAL